MAALPPAIQMMLPELVADAGRARARTLGVIQGVGPDQVRAHLAGIHTALGTASPGVGRLTELVQLAELAVSTSQPTRARQHVLSQVVLRRFVEKMRGGWQLARFDLATMQPGLIGTNGVGYVENFVPVDSGTTEALWEEVESRLSSAIDAGLSGSALGDPSLLDLLRRAVALHLVRNPQVRKASNTAFQSALQRNTDRWAGTEVAAEAFRRQYGLEPAGREALRLGAEAIQGRLVRLWTEGGLFRLSVQRLYEEVCDRFDTRGVELLTPASASKEFLLGDVPAITYKRATGAAGFDQGVAVDQADEVRMALAPRLLVLVGASNGTRSISDDEVDAYNELQVRLATEYVVHRPSANFAASIALWRR